MARRVPASGTMSPHGTASRYINGGCRCAPCSDANKAAWRKRRAAALDRLTLVGGRPFAEGITHGVVGYNYHGCRCEVCVAARAAADLGRRTRRRAGV